MTKKSRAIRPVRKRLSRRGPLYSEARKGFVQRWANDQMSNIEDLIALGYQPREKDKQANAKTIELEGGDRFATAITKTVDRDGKKSILMEIPQELYDELQAEKRYELDDMESQLSPQSRDGVDGSLSIRKQN